MNEKEIRNIMDEFARKTGEEAIDSPIYFRNWLMQEVIYLKSKASHMDKQLKVFPKSRFG